jgi:hypothetical protein
MTKLPSRDPSAVHVRKAISARRVGVGARCGCGESRPEALIRKDNQVICMECNRKKKGMKTTDKHHVAGAANSPVTITLPANDHVAELTTAQHDWPKSTLENPDGSPLLAAAAYVRGFIDTILHLVEKGLHWIADMLEKADACLKEKLGPQWWLGTPLEEFVSKC